MAHSSTTAHLPRGAVVEVPPELLVHGGHDLGVVDYVILGAGCAGLSAAVALLDAGETGSIVLVDPRLDFRDDRTWCFWDVESTPFTHLARGRWQTWEVRAVDAAGASAPASHANPASHATPASQITPTSHVAMTPPTIPASQITPTSHVASASSSAPRSPYVSIAANDFYRFALGRLAASGTVSLLAGEKAGKYAETGDTVRVATSRRLITGRQLIDARGLGMHGATSMHVDGGGVGAGRVGAGRVGSGGHGAGRVGAGIRTQFGMPEATPLHADRVGSGKARARRMAGVTPPRRSTGTTWLPQTFVGLHIVADRPVFDPGSCLLMDFAVDQSCGLRFMYVVPVSETEALVENVFLSETALSPAGFVAGIELYLSDQFGLGQQDYRVFSEEQGSIPMTDIAVDDRPSPRVTLLGTLGGATRPSTGYTFLRIQRSCRLMADRLVNSTGSHSSAAPDARPATPSALLDSIFLRFLADHPERAPRVFLRMFQAVDPDSLVRFLSDQGTWLDHARLIVALPKGWFLAAAIRVLLGRLDRA